VTDEEIPPGGTEIPDPTWDPWRPEDVARRLAGCHFEVVGSGRAEPG